MAERPPFHPHAAPEPVGIAQGHEQLTQPDRDAIRQDFLDYVNGHYTELPDDWTPEERMRHVTFEYAYERHRAERFDQLEGHGFTAALHRVLYQGPVGEHVERAKNWGREIVVGTAAGVAARTLVVGGAKLLGVTGGPAAWIAGAATGALAGGFMGYRRGRERHLTKNFDAEKLQSELEVENLITDWELNRETATQIRPEAQYQENRIDTGREFQGDYFAKVAEALEKLDAIASEHMLRGSYQDKAELTDQRARLAAILETRAFFEEQAKRFQAGERQYFGGAFFSGDDLADTWVKLQEYRTQHSLQERFNHGVSARAQKFIQEQQSLTQATARKGMVTGAVSGALLGGIFSHFIGREEMMVDKAGFGGGQVTGQEALQNAMGDKDFSALTDLLREQATNKSDVNHIHNINLLLTEHHLPSFEHYSENGHNALLNIMERIQGDPTGYGPNHAKEIMYNFLSHYDNAVDLTPKNLADGMSLPEWHQHLAEMDLRQMANPDTFTFERARDLFMDNLRANDGITSAPADATTLNAATIGQGLAGAAVGHIAGEMAGAKAPDLTHTNEPQAITADEAQKWGKPLPAKGQVWELGYGAKNYNLNSIFRVIGADPRNPLHFDIQGAHGTHTYLKLRDKPDDYTGRDTFKVLTRDMIYEKAFQPEKADEEKKEEKDKTEPDKKGKKGKEATAEQEKRTLDVPDTYDINAALRPDGTLQNPVKDPEIDNPIFITNINDAEAKEIIKDYKERKQSDEDATLSLYVMSANPHNGRPQYQARIEL